MSLLPENVLIVYNENSQDSYELAQYYASIHNIDSSQLLAVNCSLDEHLSSYSEFAEQIEEPILQHINSEYGMIVKCIVVSYEVPGSFYDSDEDKYISTTSRLSSIFEPYEYGKANPIFNRRTYTDYSDEDAVLALVVSRFDAPTFDVAKSHIDRCKSVLRTGYANGRFLFDRVTLLTNADKTAYHADLVDFEESTLILLNMPITTTVADTVNDVPLFRLKNDSFVWAWESDRAGYTYFEEHRYARIFCYNADLDGAGTVRDAEDRRWPMLAISSGYATCAGTVDVIDYDEQLRPKPFFEALLRGATIGEAFLYANPVLDSSMTLFGDPLIKVRFPTGDTITDTVTAIEGMSAIANYLADSIAYSVKKRETLKSIADIINTSDFDAKTELFSKVVRASGSVSSSAITVYKEAVDAFVSFSPTPINTFLSDNDIKVSRLLRELNGNIAGGNIATTGSWYIEAPIARAEFGYDFYHFIIELSYNPDFSNAFIVIDSREDSGFSYEKNVDEFVDVSSVGVTSSYAGRRVRYASPTTMDVGTIFYARLRQVNTLEEYTDWVELSRIINT